jgi:ATP-binding cassette subfamily B protein
VLIFDEATAALDAETEAEIVRLISEMSNTMTVILVSHRESTLQCCDFVVRMREGRVTAVERPRGQGVDGGANA